jgi:predicted permease
MLTPSQALRRIRRLLGRRSFERDLEDEMRFHMEMVASRHAERGATMTDLESLTHREFGSMQRFKEEVRDAHGLTVVDDLRRDTRLAFRTLLRTPGFTIVALLTFALGIGANTAIFSVVNSALLKPLPYPNAPRLVAMYETMKDQPEPGSVSVMNWLDWKRQAQSFEEIGGYSVSFANLDATSGEPERVRQGLISANVIPMLGVRPAIGRGFLPEEEIKGRNRVVLLSDALWHRRYGANPSIVGQTISIEGLPSTVVGIMPPGFNFPASPRRVDLWAPFVPPDMALDPRSRGWHWMSVIGLRKPGVTLAAADAEMKRIAERIKQQDPRSMANRSATVIDLQRSIVGNIRPVLLVLLAAVFLVLLIACANVANLLLARNAARRKDVAVRVALGASRGQLARQFLTESVVLALLGALLGLVVAKLSLRLITTTGSSILPTGGSVALDGRVLSVLLLAAVLCGIAFGLAPALQLSPSKLRHGLAGLTVKTTGGSDMRRFRSALVIGQIALSLMLLVGAGLLVRGFVALQSTDPGFVPDRIVTARIALARHYARDHAVTQQVLRPLLERVRAIPGVKSAGIVNMLPVDESGANASFWVDRKAWPQPGNEPMVEVRAASPDLFKTLGVHLIAGRDFTEADDSTGTRKIIVNEAAVRKLLPGENPIGRHLLQGNAEQHDDFEIVGVVSDIHQSGLDVAARPEMYSSYADLDRAYVGNDFSLVVKTNVPELSITPQLRDALKAVAPDVVLANIRSMNEVIEQSLAGRRLTLMLFGIFAAVALLLAASGLYGVIYYLVAQRTREIGIRVALGARASRVLALVLGQSAMLVGAGVILGVAGAFTFSRFLAGMVYGVSVHDPMTYLVVPLVLSTVALLATLVPAFKAARVDPVIALREE